MATRAADRSAAALLPRAGRVPAPIQAGHIGQFMMSSLLLLHDYRAAQHVHYEPRSASILPGSKPTTV